MLVQYGNTWIQKIPVLRIFFIQLFPNWTACSPITYTYFSPSYLSRWWIIVQVHISSFFFLFILLSHRQNTLLPNKFNIFYVKFTTCTPCCCCCFPDNRLNNLCVVPSSASKNSKVQLFSRAERYVVSMSIDYDSLSMNKR